jgi:hypothetical protein
VPQYQHETCHFTVRPTFVNAEEIFSTTQAYHGGQDVLELGHGRLFVFDGPKGRTSSDD